MTPKEKAQELRGKYIFTLFAVDEDYEHVKRKLLIHAKHSALIAVDEIINSNPHSNPLNTYVFSTMLYWQEVKKEIENL